MNPHVASANTSADTSANTSGSFSAAATAAPTVQMLQLSELQDGRANASVELLASINPLHQIKARLQVCVGEATLTVGELLSAREHQVITLDRQVDQAVDFLLEGKVIARGHLVAAGDYFAVRISELPLSLKV